MEGLAKKVVIFFLLIIMASISIFSLLPLALAKSEMPHYPSKDLPQIYCLRCHLEKPGLDNSEEKVIRSLLNPQYVKSCEKCHTQKIPRYCIQASTQSIADFLLSRISPFPLPLFQGKLSCLSCHQTHSQPKVESKSFLLRVSYNDFLKSAEKLSPHSSRLFCSSCHLREPISGEKDLHLRFEGDTIALCKSCHNNQRAKADNHPVNIIPSDNGKVKIPEGFPLDNGRLTCLTCHQLSCLEEKKVAIFLRGGPYQKRIDTCLVCHVKAQFLKINPHDQITDGGDIRDDRCLFCHDLNNTGTPGLSFKFKAPFNFYCLGCHPIDIQKHPFGAHHTGRPLHSVWSNLKSSERLELSQQETFKMFPLSLDGTIICTTCHNPHDIRKGPKLRISNVNKSCRQCHYKKYGAIITEEDSLGEGSSSQWLPKKELGPEALAQETPKDEDLAPDQEDQVPFGYRASLNYYCVGCHPTKESGHPYGIVHTGRFIQNFWQSRFKAKEMASDDPLSRQILPLTLSGQVGCFTCHDPHNGAKGPKLRVDSKEKLCTLCHPNKSAIIKKYLEEKSLPPPEPGSLPETK